MALHKDKKRDIINSFALHTSDTGSTEVQIALLTNRIEELTQHCKENKKDFSTKRGLLKMVCSRRKLLRYLASKNEAKYKEMIKKLGLRK